MPSQYVSVKEISPFHRKRSIRVRLIRMYEVPEVRGAQTNKSLELLFHDAEVDDKELFDVIGKVVEIYSPLDKIIGGKPSRLIDFLIADTQLAANTSPVRSISTTTVLSQSTGPSEFQSGAVIDNDFYVPAEIMGIEGSKKWLYISCMKAGCNKKLTEEEGFLQCSKCKRQYVEGTVRYKVLVRVLDKTGDAPFLLWDREVVELNRCSGIIAVCIHIPPELEILSEMAMIFKIGLKKDTMREPNSAYNVIRETSKDDEVQSPLSIDTGKRKAVDKEDSESVKKCLMDQFSTSKTTKKMKEVTVKQEKI
nr:replication protein A 70 kDa DNA-binding subunit-like [Ipomoea batatas]